MITGIIPARFASTRFPGKPLANIAGKTMIRRVYEQASRSRLLNEVIVATDDERIFAEVTAFGGKVMMTSATHPSGTDRCREVCELLGLQSGYVINIQGDEPFIEPAQIDELAAVLDDGQTEIATQVSDVHTKETLFDPGVVKAVLNTKGEALYFSRMAIPCARGVNESEWPAVHRYYRHVGMYAYRIDILEKIARLPVSSLEKAESLEQLRWLENGYRIQCVLTQFESHGIDSPEDIEKVLSAMKGK
jgi:3-deoxy-manno-octulosonate cytidylyltransferase (CMP-KDO synthetase)